MRALLALTLSVLVVGVQSAAAAGPNTKDNDTHVQLLAINDFHGNLEPPSGSSGRIIVAPGTTGTVNAGGAPNWMAIKNQELFAEHVIPRFKARNVEGAVTVAAQA